MNYLFKISIKKLIILIKNKKISNLEIVKISLNNIKKIIKKNNFNINIFEKESLNFAKLIDKKQLISIPISIKNIFNLKNKITSCNSKILKNYVSVYDSYISKILKKNNFNIISLDKSDEFCIGATGMNNSYSFNSFNKKYIVGGSSSGSSLNISFGCNILSIGSDTGGSIRTPSSYNYLVGFKPTNGSISRLGMVPYSSFLDNISIISNCVEDCYYLFNFLKYKNIDLHSNEKNINYIFLKKKILILNYIELYVDVEYIKNFNKIIKNFEKLGYNIIKLNFNFNSLNKIYEFISSKEFYSNSCKFDGIKFGYKKKIYKNINDLIKLNRVFLKNTKNKIIKGIDLFQNGNITNKEIDYLYFFLKKIFLYTDYLVIPTNILNLKFIKSNFSDYIDIFTTISNILEYPSINLKSNFINHNSIGFQIISEKNTDIELLNIAKRYEKNYYKNYVFN